MVVWTYDVDIIIPLTLEFEEKLVKLAWKNRVMRSAPNSTHQSPAATSSDVCLDEKTSSSTPEPSVHGRAPTTSKWYFGWKLSSNRKEPADPDDQDPEKPPPPAPCGCSLLFTVDWGASCLFVGRPRSPASPPDSSLFSLHRQWYQRPTPGVRS